MAKKEEKTEKNILFAS